MPAPRRVIIELAVGEPTSAEVLDHAARHLDGLVQVDTGYGPIPSAPPGGGGDDAARAAGSVLIRGSLVAGVTPEEVEALPGVIKVWGDAPLAPFTDRP